MSPEPTRCPLCSERTIRRTATYMDDKGCLVKHYECLTCSHTRNRPDDPELPAANAADG